MRVAFMFSKLNPIYRQIGEHIKSVLASGELGPGARIPSVRELAGSFGVNPNTVQRALKELETGGLLFTKRTVGRYVTADKSVLEKLRNDIRAQTAKKFIDDMGALGVTGRSLDAYMKNYSAGE